MGDYYADSLDTLALPIGPLYWDTPRCRIQVDFLTPGRRGCGVWGEGETMAEAYRQAALALHRSWGATLPRSYRNPTRAARKGDKYRVRFMAFSLGRAPEYLDLNGGDQ